jgi:hypothetical protein
MDVDGGALDTSTRNSTCGGLATVSCDRLAVGIERGRRPLAGPARRAQLLQPKFRLIRRVQPPCVIDPTGVPCGD